MKIKSRHHLKGSEAKKIVAAIEPLLSDSSSLKKASLELAETDEDVNLIFVDSRPLIMFIDDQPFFTIIGAIELSPQKKLVMVDSGAVKFIANGADVMSPGIVFADPDIKPDDLVVVVEEKYKRPLAIGRALIPAGEMHGEGKAVKSLHHVGDQIWKGLEQAE